MAAEAARAGNGPLFLFPGGRLDYKENGEYLGNSVYSLANTESLDGMIIWTSSLSGTISMEEANRFVEAKAMDLPVVSIGEKVPGVPSVCFDAYSGMKAEIAHLIREHGQRRIAFLRGPEAHRSAELRYQAYLDALKDADIDLDERLVSSPVAWSAGDDAIKELVETRGLMPGKDFTALVASSDLLLLKAYQFFSCHGLRFPEDLRLAGFNDNEDDLTLLGTRTTTVRLPVSQLAHSAFACISQNEGSRDIILPTKLVVRKSCGCEHTFADARYTSRSFLKELSGLLDSDAATEAAVKLLEALKEDPLNSAGMEREISVFVDEGADIDVLIDAIPVYFKLEGLTMGGQTQDMLYRMILREQHRRVANDRLSTLLRSRILNDFKTELISSHTLDQVVACMVSAFPRLSISKGFLFLYENFSEVCFCGGFSGDRIYKETERFRKGPVVCASLEQEVQSGVFVVEPLYQGNEELGYLVLCTEETAGHILEDIRTAMSSAVKGVRLFEETQKAKEQAERNEREAREFYVNISEGVMQPLKELLQMVQNEEMDREALADNLLSAERLLEISLADRIEPDFRKVLCPLRELLEKLDEAGAEVDGPSELPALEIDKEHMLEAMSAVAAELSPEYPVRIQVSLGREGVHFKLSGDGIVRDKSSQALLVARKVILMHSGLFFDSGSDVTIVLPYPTLSGEASSGIKEGRVLYVKNSPKEEVPDSLLPFEPFEVEELNFQMLDSSSPSALAWRRDNSHAGSVLIKLLRSHKATRGLPFLCFGLETEKLSLLSSLEGAASIDSVAVCSFCKVPKDLSGLTEFGDIVRVSGVRDLEKFGAPPLLLLFDRIDLRLFSEIRQHRMFQSVPFLLVRDSFTTADAESLSAVPNLLMVNSSILESDDFKKRLVSVLGGEELLPALTGALVKKAVAYLNENATSSISRWKLAGAVNISEDYLTRIFRREIGLSPWEYLSRYRIQLASDLLLSTGMSISEIASDIGFQDQAYFCRVFKKIKGFPPGKLRQR